MAAVGPMGVIRSGEGLVSRPWKNKVGNFGMIDGAGVSSRFGIDLAADAKGGFPDFEIRSLVADKCGIKNPLGNHDGIVADLGMSRALAEHKLREDNKGISGSGQKAPTFQFGKRGFCLSQFLLEMRVLRFAKRRVVEELLLNPGNLFHGSVQKRIGMLACLGPAVIGLRLEEEGCLLNRQIAVPIRAIRIHIHQSLYQDCTP